MLSSNPNRFVKLFILAGLITLSFGGGCRSAMASAPADGGMDVNNRRYTGEGSIRMRYMQSAMGAAAASCRQPDFQGTFNAPPGSDQMTDQKEASGQIEGSKDCPGSSLYAISGSIPISFINFPTYSKFDENAVKNNWMPTTGEKLTDSALQAIDYNIARVSESLENDPQTQMHNAEAQGQAQSTEAGNAAADTARDQSAGAISFCANYLMNFTTQPIWNTVRDQIFVPMAILLLLPGAVLAQARAIVAAGSPVLGEVNPFEGILRSIVAIFLIPATALVVNYGIDLNNSIMYTISYQYTNIFGSNMYKDALCAEIRATPVRQTQSNRNAYDLPTYQGTPLLGGNTPFAQFEGAMMENSIQDPCANINQAPQERADEAMSSGVAATRMMMNGSNASLCSAWNILCAFQMAYLYYLWCVGPIMAALWVYPLRTLRNALPSWVEGVITLCFWSLFWNTVILLMACFKGVDETGTMIMTALNFLATASVKYAFDFAGLVKAAGQEAAGMAAGAAKGAAGAGSGGGSHGGATKGNHSSGGARKAGGHFAHNGATGGRVAANKSGEEKRLAGAGGLLGRGAKDDSAGATRLASADPVSRSMVAAANGSGFTADPRASKGGGDLRPSGVTEPPKAGRAVDEPGVHRNAKGDIIGVDVAAAGDGRASFALLAAKMNEDAGISGHKIEVADPTNVPLGAIQAGVVGTDGMVSAGALAGVSGSEFGFSVAGVHGSGAAGLDGMGVAGAVGAQGLNSSDVLRTAHVDGTFAGIPLHIAPPEGAVVLGGKPNPDLAGAKNPLGLDWAADAAAQNPNGIGTVGPMLFSNAGDGVFGINAPDVGLPPLADAGDVTAIGFDPNAAGTSVDLAYTSVDGGDFTSIDMSNELAYDNSLVNYDTSQLSYDTSQLSYDQAEINNLNSAIASNDTFNYDAGTFVDASQLLTASQLAQLTNTDPAALAAQAQLAQLTHIDPTTVASQAQLAAMASMDPTAITGLPAGATSLAANGVDTYSTITGLPINGDTIHAPTFAANGVDTYSTITGLPINGGDTTIHAPMIDASTLNASSSWVNAGGNSYTDMSQYNGVTRDLMQGATGAVDTAQSSNFAMFGRDTSVSTSALVDIWSANQSSGGVSIDPSITTGQAGQGTPISYDYSAGNIDQSTVYNGGSNIDQSMATAQANGGPVNYDYTVGSSMFNATSISDWTTNNDGCQLSVDNGSYLTPQGAMQLQTGGDDYHLAGNQQFDNNSLAYATNNSCTVEGGSFSTDGSFSTTNNSTTVDGGSFSTANNSTTVDGGSFSTANNTTVDGGSFSTANNTTVDSGTAFSNASSFATYSSATIDNSAVDNSQVSTAAGDQYADHSQTYNHSAQGGSTEIAYSSAPTFNNDSTFCGAPQTYNNNEVAYGSSATQYNNDSYNASATHYNNDVTYTAPPAAQNDTSGACTADNARYAAYSTGGYAADANWTTSFSAPPTVEGDNHIAYNSSYGVDASQIPTRTTDSWFDSSSTTNNIASAAAAPMIESPRANEVIGHSDLGIAMPIVPKQVFASAEPAAPAPVAKAPIDQPRSLAMNTTKSVNANRLTAAMGRAAGQSRNGVPAPNTRTVVASNSAAAANGTVPARTASGAQEYARLQPQGPNGNEPPPAVAAMPDSLQTQLMLHNQRGGRIQKTDAEDEATMKMRLDQMTGFDGSTPV